MNETEAHAETDAQTEAATLVGFREVPLSTGRTVKVRGYGFMEGLKVIQIAGPLMTALQAFFSATRAGEDISLLELQKAFAVDPAAMVELLVLASDLDAAEIQSLGDADGELLLWAWWTMNADFFVRRLVEQASAQAAMRTARAEALRDASPG